MIIRFIHANKQQLNTCRVSAPISCHAATDGRNRACIPIPMFSECFTAATRG